MLGLSALALGQTRASGGVGVGFPCPGPEPSPRHVVLGLVCPVPRAKGQTRRGVEAKNNNIF